MGDGSCSASGGCGSCGSGQCSGGSPLSTGGAELEARLAEDLVRRQRSALLAVGALGVVGLLVLFGLAAVV